MIFALNTDEAGCRSRNWSGHIVRSGVQRFIVAVDADAVTHYGARLVCCDSCVSGFTYVYSLCPEYALPDAAEDNGVFH